jgi:hypothetical protein
MTKLLNLKDQTVVLDVLWYFTKELEEKCNNSSTVISKAYIKKKQQVTDLYNLLNRLGYTQTRPNWEHVEDSRQLKLFK